MVILPILWIIAVVVGAIYGFVIGLRAFGQGLRHQDEYAYTLHFLAINVCEPLVSMSLILAFLIAGGLDGLSVPFLDTLLPQYSGRLLTPLLLTAPMSVLLIPAIGLFFRNLVYRRLNFKVLRLGLGRWGINLTVFYLVALFEDGGFAVGILLVLGGTGVLWYSVLWGKATLAQLLAQPGFGVAQTATI